MKTQKPKPGARRAAAVALLALGGCGDRPWNDPYGAVEPGRQVLYDAFTERPKHLDPTSSYSENEAVFTQQIYEPPLQYAFLKIPYTLEPLTAIEVPQPACVDGAGAPVEADTPAESVARCVYRVRIRSGIRYQPHPAFARDASGRHLYFPISPQALAGRHGLADFPQTGTRELVAADYVYQIKRLAHPRVHSPVAGVLGAYILGLNDLGKRLARDYGPGGRFATQAWVDLREEPLEGARVVDRYTYEIVIRGLYPQFKYWLAMPFFAPIPWEADRFYAQPGMAERNITLDWYPVGTGAYMLTENNPNRRMVLSRNPNYRGDPYPADGDARARADGLLADAGRATPFIDAAVYSLERENIPEWNKFRQGYYDTAGLSSDVFDQAVQFSGDGGAELTPQMRAQGVRMRTMVAPQVSYIGFNMRDAVVGGDGDRARLLRRAIAIAVDYEEFISIFLNGRGIAAQGPIPPGIFGYREGAPNPFVYDGSGARASRKPIEQARALLAQAGYPGGRDRDTGRPLVLNFDTLDAGPDSKALFDWLRKQFAKLDIQLVIRATDYNRFQDKVLKGTAQIYQWGWNADYPDPENFLFLFYGPNGKVGHGGENASNYDNRAFDALFDRMKTLPDGPERQQAIDEMVAILRNDGPWLWGFHPVGFVLYHQWYGNAFPNLMARNTLKYRRIDAPLRDRLRREWNRPVTWPVQALVALVAASLVPAWLGYRRRERAAALSPGAGRADA
ncbi:MAG: ABC transporter substrate-binding protein [Gammaproteobacteria bacterium]